MLLTEMLKLEIYWQKCSKSEKVGADQQQHTITIGAPVRAKNKYVTAIDAQRTKVYLYLKFEFEFQMN